jgi:NAD(P)-dependent dehydrogenase (short-subunit alcohol dehydrogenase family)
MNVAGKVAIITGAGGGGQGRAVALRLAREGATTVISDIDETGGYETVRRIEAAGGKAAFFRADVSIETDIHGLIQFAESTMGGLDILVNNAGPYIPGDKLQNWDQTMRANLLGPIWATLAAIEPMKKRGGGVIIYYGSTSAIGHGLKHSPSPAYDVAKEGVTRFTTTMAWLNEAFGIRTNCIVPDWVATDEIREYVDSLTPDQRRSSGVPDSLITLDEIAEAVLHLIKNDQLSGRILVWWSGREPGLIPAADPGYASLEPFRKF